jgi:hypothetical protein
VGDEIPNFESRLHGALATLPRELHALLLLVLELPREKTAAVLGVLRSDEGSRTLAEWLTEVQEDPVILELLLEELRRLGRRHLTNRQGR